MRGLQDRAALRAMPEIPKIVFLAQGETRVHELVGLLRRELPAFAIDIHNPFASPKTSDDAVRLVLARPGGVTDFTAHLLACRRLYPAASIGLLVDSSFSVGLLELMQCKL
ncbi:MAG: hypothetical protein EOO38_30125, partial [Cytophagaceae bacterium]